MKQNKNAFTLIELLAVIVVLAILALIAVPIVLKIINNIRENSYKRSIESYARSAEYALSKYSMNNPDEDITNIDILDNKLVVNGNLTEIDLDYKGEIITCIDVAYDSGKVSLECCSTSASKKNNKYYNYENGQIKNEDSCSTSDIYKIGDEIEFGDSNYYVIEDSDSNQNYVTAIKKNPLTYNEIESILPTELKSEIQKNGLYLQMKYLYDDNCTSNCNVNYDFSQVKKVIDSWANTLPSGLREIDGYKARLITYEELVNNIGFEKKNVCTGNCYEVINAPDSVLWIYNSNYSYWTMSPYNDSQSNIWTVGNYGSLSYSKVNNTSKGVRPVINVKKAKIKKAGYEIGDLVKFDNSDYYVISDHNSSKDYITLLKDVPLTYDEVTQIVEENNFKINEYTSVAPGKVYNYKWSDYMGNIYGGYGAIAYYTSSSCGYVNNKWVKSGCTNDYEKSYIKKILDEWIKNLPEGLKEINGYKVRLITLDELRKFGIEEQSTDTNGYSHSNSSVPNWLNLNHWYWSMTPADDSDINVWIVNGGSGMKPFPVYSDGGFQTRYLLGLIRPVINVSTDMLNK